MSWSVSYAGKLEDAKIEIKKQGDQVTYLTGEEATLKDKVLSLVDEVLKTEPVDPTLQINVSAGGSAYTRNNGVTTQDVYVRIVQS